MGGQPAVGGQSGIPGSNVGYEGCPGLEQVTFFIKTNLWKISGGVVPADAIIRPAATQGITGGMVNLHASLSLSIAALKSGGSLPAIDNYKWSQNRPEFRFCLRFSSCPVL